MPGLHDDEFHSPQEKPYRNLPLEDRPNSALAVVSLVFGILTWSALPFLGAIISVVTGHAGLSQIREERGRLGGRALAQAGLVLGYLQFALLLAAGGILAWILPMRHVVTQPAPEVRAATKVATPSGRSLTVKFASEIDADDLALIDQRRLNPKGDDVIAMIRGSEPQPSYQVILTDRVLSIWAAKHPKVVRLSSQMRVEDRGEMTGNQDFPYLMIVGGSETPITIPLPTGTRGNLFRDVLTTTLQHARLDSQDRPGS